MANTSSFFPRLQERGQPGQRIHETPKRLYGGDLGKLDRNWRFARASTLYNSSKARQQSISGASRFLRSEDEVAAQFAQLRSEWQRDTMLSSDHVAILMHPAYYKIVGLGLQVLPHIFKDLAVGGGPWFLALEAITHDTSVTAASGNDTNRLRENWLTWGRDNGYAGS